MTRWRTAEAWAAAALPAAAVLGMAPVNLVLGLGLAFVLRRAFRGELRLPPPGWSRVWVYGVALYLGTRLFAVVASPDVAISLQHMAKDWRLVALVWGATGVLENAPRRAAWLPAAVLAAAVVLASLDFAGIELGRFGGAANFGGVRSGGFHTGPATISGVAGLLLLMTLAWPAVRALRVTTAVLAATLLAAAASRGYILGTVAGGTVGVWLLGRRRLALVGALAALAMLAALPNMRARLAQVPTELETPGRSLSVRLMMWREGLAMGIERPLGIGPGRFQTEVQPRIWAKYGTNVAARRATTIHSHSNLIEALATGGIPGLLGMLAWLGGLLLACRSNTGWDPTGVALWTAMVVAGMFDLAIYDGEVAVVFLFLMGAAIARAGNGTAAAAPRTEAAA